VGCHELCVRMIRAIPLWPLVVGVRWLEMTLADLGNIGEFIGAIGVIASLIYVGLEVRRNTKALRAQAHETVVSGYMDSINVISQHAETFAKGIQSTYDEFKKFPDDEKVVFVGMIFGFFKHFEQIHAQYRQGLIGEEEWSAWSEHIGMQFHQAGPQWWWKLRRSSFAPPFREYLDHCPRPEMELLTDILKNRGNHENR